jgi:hypothetical protein
MSGDVKTRQKTKMDIFKAEGETGKWVFFAAETNRSYTKNTEKNLPTVLLSCVSLCSFLSKMWWLAKMAADFYNNC